MRMRSPLLVPFVAVGVLLAGKQAAATAAPSALGITEGASPTAYTRSR